MSFIDTTKGYATEEDAFEVAKNASLENETRIFVILSNNEYYVDTDSFIRTWETIVAIFCNGEQE